MTDFILMFVVIAILGVFFISFVIAFIYEVVKIGFVFVINNPEYSESDIEELKKNVSKNANYFYKMIFRNSLIITLCFYLINIVFGM